MKQRTGWAWRVAGVCVAGAVLMMAAGTRGADKDKARVGPPPATQPIAGAKAKAGEYEVSKTYPVHGEGQCQQLSLDAEGKILYVSRSMRMQAIETATGKLAGEISVKYAHGVVVVPDAGRGFMTNGSENTVTVFDPKTYAVLGKIAMDGAPSSITYDAVSKRVLVCCTEGKCLVPFPADMDLKSGKPETAIELGGRPVGLVSDGQGSVYVDLFDSDEIALIDSKSMSMLIKWPQGGSTRPTGISMDPDRGRLFVGTRTMRLSVLSVVDGHEITGVEINAQIEATGFAKGKVFVACTDGNLRVVGQTAEGRYVVEQVIKTSDFSTRLAVDSKAGTVYVPAADTEASHRPVRDSFKVLVLEKK